MFTIENDDIRISKGDSSGKFSAELQNEEGEPYELQSGDMLLLRVKRRTTDDDALIEIECDTDMQFELLPEHTKDLGCGGYKYDLWLKCANDDSFHPIAVHDFFIEEVI